MNNDYWTWIWSLWLHKTDWQRRLLFADWLDEHDMPVAAKKQREYARIIRAAHLIEYFPAVGQCYLHVGKRQIFRLKANGHVYPMSRGFRVWYNGGTPVRIK